MLRLLALLTLMCLPLGGLQAQVKQSGTITPGHAVRWITNGVIGDAGTAANPVIPSFGVLGGPICVNSAPVTGPYNQTCLKATTNGGSTISSYAYGGATSPGITFDINGSLQGFLTAALPVSNGNVACFNGTAGNIKDCGGGYFATTYVAATTGGSANAQTITSPLPAGFTLTAGYTVCAKTGFTNTDSTTLSIAGTTATAINRRSTVGLSALSGGEMKSGISYCWQYDGSVYELLTTTPGSVEEKNGDYVATALDGNGDTYIFTTVAILTIPHSTTIPNNWKIFVYAENGNVTVTPNVADSINGGSTGASVIILSGLSSFITTDGAGNIFVPVTSAGALANPTTPIDLSTHNGVLTTALRSDAAPPLSQAIVPTWTGLHTFANGINSNTLLLQPAAGALQAFATLQNLSGGPNGSPLQANQINILSDNYNGSAFPTNAGFAVNYAAGGTVMSGGRHVIDGTFNLTATSAAANPLKEYVAIAGNCTISANDGGTLGTRAGACFGAAFVAHAGASGTHLLGLKASESGVSIETSAANAPDIVANWSLAQLATHAANGKIYDASLLISNASGLGMLNGILFGNASGTPPVGTTGCLICTQDAATVAKGIDLSSYTISGNAWASVGATLTGSGAWSALSLTAPSYIGGSGTIGTQLTFKTTTGNGTTDQFAFIGGNNGGTSFALLSATAFTVQATTVATSKSTGAVVVGGGLGVNGKGYFGDAIYPGASTYESAVGKFYTTVGPGGNGLTITGQDSGASGTNDFGFFSIDGAELFTNPHNSHNIKFAGAGGTVGFGAGAFTANGSVATVLGSIGPAGAHTAVQKWFTVNDGSATYYIPGF